MTTTSPLARGRAFYSPSAAPASPAARKGAAIAARAAALATAICIIIYGIPLAFVALGGPPH